MANFTCLAAARDAVLTPRRAGTSPSAGSSASPGVRVLVGEERHDSVDLVLRYLGLGAPEPVAADDQGRLDAAALRRARSRRRRAAHRGGAAGGQRALGRLRPVRRGDRRSRTTTARGSTSTARSGCSRRRRRATGTWCAATRRPTPGRPTPTRRSTSRTTAALAIVRDPAALRAAMSMVGPVPDPATPPATRSRRCPSSAAAAGRCPVWAVLRSLGRSGVADLVDRLVRARRPVRRRASPRSTGAEVLNDVVFTQVCAAFGDDARTLEVVERMLADGTAWTSGSVWRGRAVLRISVSNWSTTDRRRRPHARRAPRRRGGVGRGEPRLDRLAGVRIARFTTGDDPQYGVVTGELDEYGQPADDAVVVALAGDPLYVGHQG